MKHLILLLLLCSPLTLYSNTSTNNSKNNIPNPSSPAKQVIDDDKDGKVVAESMGTMLQALGTFSQNPNNPVVAGACALQALGAFIKMLIQVFDDFAPMRNHVSQKEIELRFRNLPKEKQIQIMQLMIAYARAYNQD